MNDSRLVAPAVGAWAACFFAVANPGWALAASVVAWILAGVALVMRKPSFAVSLAVIGVVCAVVAVQAPARTPLEAVDAAGSGRIVEASISVTQSVTAGAPHFRGQLRAMTVGGVESRFSSTVPVLVFDASDEARRIGESIGVSGRLTMTAAGDSAAFLFFADTVPVRSGDPPAFLAVANTLRGGFVDASAELVGDGGMLLPGLAIGDTSAVSDDFAASMTASGLSHLTAVSGANCAIVIGLVLVVGARFRWARPLRVAIAIAVLLAFIVLVTPEPSVVRAAAMAILVLLAVLMGRPIRGIPVIALAVIILLVADPWYSRSFAFALSVLATTGLVVLSRPYIELFRRWMPLPLAAVIAVPVAAQIACQPVLILLQPSISLVGLVANVLAAPAAPVATIVGLVACLALPTLPFLGEWLLRLAWVPSAWIAAVARFFAPVPLAIPWLPGALGATSLAALTLFGLHAWLGRRWRRVSAVVALGLVAATAGASAGVAAVAQWNRPADYTIAMCDIGQGDAAVVRSAGRTMLIDTGPEPKPLEQCLATLGIARLDVLVLTHFDLDHVGGAAAVTSRVDSVLVGPTASADDEAIVESFRAAGANVQSVSAGMAGILGNHRYTVMWPLAKPEFKPGNDSSIVLHLAPTEECTVGCASALFLADLGEDSQLALARASPIPEVDVVKVAHHGSADQSPQLYADASATVALIGVGENSYGHPTASLLDLLQQTATSARRTDTQGLILVSMSASRELSVWTEHAGDSGEP